ncbi:MAG: MerC domain-containing protein [Ignavibacteria bacterium]|nr:MerC domain-containing protein [Ignavibacteria bacterium]
MTNTDSHKIAIRLDSIGATASLICAIHCALFPAFMVILALYGMDFAAGTMFESVFILTSVCIGFFTFYHGFRNHHRKFYPALIFLLGLTIIVASHLLFHSHESAKPDSFNPDYMLSPFGALLIATGHLLNRKLSKKITSTGSCCRQPS